MRVGMKVGRKDAYRSLRKWPADSRESLNPELSGRIRLEAFDDINGFTPLGRYVSRTQSYTMQDIICQWKERKAEE
jgi:hypothetical protein